MTLISYLFPCHTIPASADSSISIFASILDYEQFNALGKKVTIKMVIGTFTKINRF